MRETKRKAAIEATEKISSGFSNQKSNKTKTTTSGSSPGVVSTASSGQTSVSKELDPPIAGKNPLKTVKFLQNIPASNFSQENIDKAFSFLCSDSLDFSNLTFDENSKLDTAFVQPDILDTSVKPVMPGEENENKDTVQISSSQMDTIAQKVVALINVASQKSSTTTAANPPQALSSSQSDSALASCSSSTNGDLFDHDETSFRLQVGSERSLLKQHPYLFYLFKIGKTKVEKNLALYSDWNINRMITIWRDEKPDVEHAKMLAFASTKIAQSWISLKSGSNTPSLFVKTVNAIDRSFYNGHTLTRPEIVSLITELKEESEQPVWSKTNNYKSSAPSSQPGRSFKTCHQFNSSEGCRNSSCSYPHSCSFHAKKGVRANHSVMECEAKANSSQ